MVHSPAVADPAFNADRNRRAFGRAGGAGGTFGRFYDK